MGDGTPTPISPGESGNISSICLKLMNLLVGYSRRWKSLSLGYGVKPSHQRALERLVADEVPLLETVRAEDVNLFIDFHVSFPGMPPTNTGQVPEPRLAPVSHVLCKLSSLRSLHLQQASMSSLYIPLDWARLTELSFNFQPTMNFASATSPITALQRIAQTCRSLVILTFRSKLSPEGTLIDPVVWSSLRELRLIFDPNSSPQPPAFAHTSSFPLLPHVKDVYSSIITPQLLRLTLELGDRHWGGPSTDENQVPFHKLIKGAPRLSHLQIVGYHTLGAEALSRSLQKAPSVTTLKLQPERFSDRRMGCGMRMIRYGAAQPPSEQFIVPPTDWVPKLLSSLNELGSCPQLEVLDCGRCRPEDVTSILEFVQHESRLSRMKQLRADMGELVAQQVHTMTSTSLLESLYFLRATHGISVKLKWGEVGLTPGPQWKMTVNPYSGLLVPAISPWEGGSN
ncbi:hypothetical protein AAF712_002910 [Marasmius tenuissimus]|uniref:F-box domain-containing protein n=1 Tax=Marasmius tenuissimus TaxID=585030 RepID=A0ABR3A8U5_9AGAR